MLDWSLFPFAFFKTFLHFSLASSFAFEKPKATPDPFHVACFSLSAVWSLFSGHPGPLHSEDLCLSMLGTVMGLFSLVICTFPFFSLSLSPELLLLEHWASHIYPVIFLNFFSPIPYPFISPAPPAEGSQHSFIPFLCISSSTRRISNTVWCSPTRGSIYLSSRKTLWSFARVGRGSQAAEERVEGNRLKQVSTSLYNSPHHPVSRTPNIPNPFEVSTI